MGKWTVRLIEEPDDPLGPDEPIGGTTGKHEYFAVRFLGKRNNTPKYPFTVANEVVAGFIGQCLGQPVPTVIAHKTDSGHEVALSQWGDVYTMPTGDVPDFVREHPREVHGAIVFDLFIGNNDRAFTPLANIKFDRSGRMFLFDHGSSCFYREQGGFNGGPGIVAGIPRLNAVESSLTALDIHPHRRRDYFQRLTDWSLVEEWCERVRALPDFLLESAAAPIPREFSRPTLDERERLVSFFTNRKTRLLDDIRACQDAMFPGLPKRSSNA